MYWYDMSKDGPRQRYDLGESVIKILAGRDSVLAVTTGGKIMVIKPRFEKGEHFGAALDMLKPDLFSQDTPEVLDEGSTLEIDGVKLEKRQWD